jgi:hypothetical protein
MGSFSGKGVIESVDCSKCCAVVKFSMTNDAGWESATRLPTVGYGNLSDGSRRPALFELSWQRIKQPLALWPGGRPASDALPKSLINNNAIPKGFGRTININITWSETVCWGSKNDTK